jgi:hypothetical protein
MLPAAVNASSSLDGIHADAQKSDYSQTMRQPARCLRKANITPRHKASGQEQAPASAPWRARTPAEMILLCWLIGAGTIALLAGLGGYLSGFLCVRMQPTPGCPAAKEQYELGVDDYRGITRSSAI